MKVVPALAAIAALSPAALASSSITLNGNSYTTEFNTGSGPDHALLVLQYGANAYAFGYSFDDAATNKSGYDMLTAVAANSSNTLTLDVSIFDFGDGPIPFVNTIHYLTNTPANSYPNSWFNYFTADANSNWTNSFLGAQDRLLANNSADDWVWQNVAADANFNPQVLPTFPINAPEPASLGVLGLGLLCLTRRRK